ncbi:hypothetical protein CHUAL_011127 [Chamberlinius hualienensis]
MKTVADLLQFYIACFKLYGIDFQPTENSFLRKVYNCTFKLITVGEALFVPYYTTCLILMQWKLLPVTETAMNLEFGVHYLGNCLIAATVSKWYVIRMMFKYSYAKQLFTMISSSLSKIPGDGATKTITNLHIFLMAFIVLNFAWGIISSFIPFLTINYEIKGLSIMFFGTLTVYFQIYFNSLCCLFIATIIDHVNAFHDEIGHSFSGTSKKLKKATNQYIYYKKLSKNFNALLSPILLQSSLMSLLSIVMSLRALIIRKIDCVPLICVIVPQLLNAASTMLCLGKVAKVKTKHFQFVRQLMVKFSEEKCLPISAIKDYPIRLYHQYDLIQMKKGDSEQLAKSNKTFKSETNVQITKNELEKMITKKSSELIKTAIKSQLEEIESNYKLLNDTVKIMNEIADRNENQICEMKDKIKILEQNTKPNKPLRRNVGVQVDDKTFITSHLKKK